jgi:hypothetical protein
MFRTAIRSLSWPLANLLAETPAGVLCGQALELIGAQGTAITSVLAAAAAVTGDSLAVRSSPTEKLTRLVQCWTDVQVAGTVRIRSPRMHDNVQGIRFDTIVSDLYPLFPWGTAQRVYANDVLNVDLAGSSTAGDIEYALLMLLYEDLGGAAGHFIAPDELLRRGVNISSVENTIATGATAAWAGSEAINAEFDQFHANSQYALVGYVVDVEAPAVAWRGPDTSNYRVGGPGLETDRSITVDWFVKLSKALGVPLIPVFTAENKAGTNIDALQDENGADTTIISTYVELGK